MMRKVIIIMLLFISAISKGQVYTNDPSYGKNFNRVNIGKILQIPTDTTLDGSTNPCVQIAKIDNTIYTYNCDSAKWVQIVGADQGIQLALDSARRSNDTLFFRYTTGGELAVPIPPGSLQQTTDVGNITNNTIVLSGANNIQNIDGLHLMDGSIYSGNLYTGTKKPLIVQATDVAVGATGQGNYNHSGNALFSSTLQTTIQSGTGMRFYTGDGTPATFNTRVNGVDAVLANEFTTRQQVDSFANADTTKYIKNQIVYEQNADAWIKDFRAKRIGIGRSPGRLFEAVSGTALFGWNGKGIVIADDTVSTVNVFAGYKAWLSGSGASNTGFGYSVGQGLNGSGNAFFGYAVGIANIGNYNTVSGFRGMYNSNNNFSSGFGYQVFYDLYGNYNTAIGANILINSNSYRNVDTIHAADINNTVISGAKIRSIIDVLGLRNDSIYIGRLRWLTTLPINGSPTFYKFSVDSVLGTLTSQTYSHNVDTGAGLVVINILPRINNSSVIGANATIDSSNQVVLGDTTAVLMKTGRWKWDIGSVPADGDVWTYNNTRRRWTTGALSTTYASKQNGQLVKFNYIGGSPTTNPIIAVNPSGWDQGINEIGNVIKVGSTYIMVYSGYITPYVQDAVYIGLATSSDGITWTKGGPASDGKITTTASEDPYLVYNAGTYYLYVEKKVTPVTGIELFTSTDLLAWTSQGIVVDKGAGGTWEENDVSSPTVLLENGTWTMFYEGRSPTQSGAVGVATSSDGIVWTKYGSNPVMGGTGTLSTITWAVNTVPDDIFKIEGRYYLSFHGSHPSVYSGAMAVSTNLLSWKDYLGSWLLTDVNNESTGDGIMYYFDGNEYVANYVGPAGGIYRGRLVMKTEYAIGSKAISTTGTLAAGATTVTGTLNVSGSSTLAAVSATTGTFSGVVAMPSGFTTNGNSNNIFVPSAQGGGSSGSSKFQVGTSTTLNFRRAYGGGTALALAVNSSYAGSVFGTEDYTPAASGLHENGSTVLIKTLTTTGGTANTTFKYNLIVEGEPVGGLQNGSAWIKGRTKISKTFHGSATDTILVKRADSTIGGLAANELSFNASQVTAGTLPIGRGGTGLAALGTTLQQIRVNAGATALEYFTATTGGTTYVFSAPSGDYTILSTDQWILNSDNSAPAPTWTIPTASTAGQGKWYLLTNESRNGSLPVTVTQDIYMLDGTITRTLNSGASIRIVSDINYWRQVDGSPASPKALKDFYADVSNTSTTETDIFTYTTIASTLNNNGEKLKAEYNGNFVGSGTATKQIRVYFAGTLIFDSNTLTVSSSGSWSARVSIIRSGSTTARATVNITTPGASTATYTTETDVTGITYTNTNILKITATAGGVGAATGDIIGKHGDITWYPAAP